MPQYLSYLRRGLGAQIVEPANAQGWPNVSHATLSARLQLEGLTDDIRRNIALRGPEDVATLDSGAISRVEPASGSRDCAPGFFPYVELADPGLPWLFTPAAPAPSGRLVPWLVLVVLPRSDTVRLTQISGGAGQMLSISAQAGRLLPSKDEAYGWAHLEYPEGMDAQTALEQGAMTSRLICPIRLLPQTDYLAAVVPVFAQGVAAGLGRPIPTEDVIPASAWDDESDSLDLPAYYTWQFTTGVTDFEDLVRRLSPHPTGPQVGLHDLDISRPRGGLDITTIAPGVPTKAALVSFQGALVSPSAEPRGWAARHRAPFETQLFDILDPPTAKAPPGRYDALTHDPVVAPPIYGAWQKGQDGLRREGMDWMRSLNLSPENRVAAGLGAQAIRRNQEDLVARAWAAAAGAREIHTHLRQSRAALATAGRVHLRLTGLAPTAMANMATRLSGDVVKSAPALATLTPEQGVPNGALTAIFRRLTTQTAGRLPQATKVSTKNPATAALLTSTARLSTNGAAASFGNRFLDPDQGRVVIGSYQVQGEAIPPAARFESLAARFGMAPPPTSPAPLSGKQRFGGLGDSIPARKKQNTLDRALAASQPQPIVHSAKISRQISPPQLGAIRQEILTLTKPAKVLPPCALARVTGLSATSPRRAPIPPRIEVQIEFEEPMYAQLASAAAQYFLPGYGTIPEDSVSILASNQSFVESYLLGLNTEMAREFAWRQFPIRLDGTWFRRFWSYLGDPDHRDITPIASWPDKRPLGLGSSKGKTDAVILVKGDLFRRYPDTLIYIVPAKWVPRDDAAPEALSSLSRLRPLVMDDWIRLPVLDKPKAVIWPMFTGRIGSSGSFFGFDRTPQALIGEAAPRNGKGDAGYFVVFEQAPGAPKFGLDARIQPMGGKAPERADDLTWGHFARSPAEVEALRFASLSPPWSKTPIEGLRWGLNAAETAALSRQRLVRMAVHADSLLQAGSK